MAEIHPHRRQPTETASPKEPSEVARPRVSGQAWGGGVPGEFIRLQRTVGNRYVTSLLSQRGANAVERSVETASARDQADEVAATIAGGASGPGQALPNLPAVQGLFGRHDVSSIRAHTGAAAVEATKTLGGGAYASQGSIVLGRSTDLHTVAHEAAHVVQQRNGHAPAGGAGRAGDVFERHANAVADEVVAGRPAEQMLDRGPSGADQSGAGASVQFLMGSMKSHLVKASGDRSENANFKSILDLLDKGERIQKDQPTVRAYDQLLGLIASIRGLVPAARSKVGTRFSSKRSNRNGALDALLTSLTLEETYIQRFRAQSKDEAKTALNAPMAGNNAPVAANLTGTGPQQGASGSYFNKGPVGANGKAPVLGIFKPESQEGGARAGRDARGAGAIREVLGDKLDQRLGLGVVPRTRLAAIDSPTLAGGAHPKISGSGDTLQVGSYQQGVANPQTDINEYLVDDDENKRNFNVDSLQKMAILDMLSLNKDRHGGNVMVDQADRLHAIDQGEMAPSAMAFVSKFEGATAASGWAWADIPEAERDWNVANSQIIANMDPEAEVDALADEAKVQSGKMAALSGADPTATHLSAQSIAMMKYAGRTLKLCAQAGLTPSQTETIYTARGLARDAKLDEWDDVKRTGKEAGGGEFAQFVKATFFQDGMATQIAQATGTPPPPEVWTYGAPATEALWAKAMATGLDRVAQANPTKAAGINAVLNGVFAPQAAPALGPAVDNATPVAGARQLWAHFRMSATAIGATENLVMDRIWDKGSPATRDRILAVLQTQGTQLRMSHLGYLVEAVDPAHRMNLITPLKTWSDTNVNQDFWAWVAHNAPAPGEAAAYMDDNARANARIAVAGGRLTQGVGALNAPMDTTAEHEGWTIVLSGGDFYSKAKGGAANAKNQHSSFMAGLPVDAAGMAKVTAGTLTLLNNYSGHYAPTIPNMVRMILRMRELGVALAGVKIKDVNGMGARIGRLTDYDAMEYLGLAKANG
jgi:hypothetical protein